MDEKYFESWIIHYNNDLIIMYNNYIKGKFKITFEEFCQMAYLCSKKERYNGLYAPPKI